MIADKLLGMTVEFQDDADLVQHGEVVAAWTHEDKLLLLLLHDNCFFRLPWNQVQIVN